MRLKVLLISLYVTGLALSFFMGCSKLNVFGSSDFSSFSQLPSWDENEGSIPNDRFFYIRLARDNYAGHSFLQHALYELDAGPGTDCKIPIDQESSEDIFCQLEKIEGDLWGHPTPIEYNVPPGMCDYLGFQVPWHFNQNAGYGPRIIHKDERTIGTGDNAETEDRYCTDGPGRGACSAEIENLCGYDLSDRNDDLANCCIGDYAVSGEDQSDGSWGESLEQCLGGLGRVNWNARNDLGIPLTLVTSTERDGHIETYEIPSIESFYDGGDPTRGSLRISGPSFVVANYYEDIEDFNLDNLPKLYETDPLPNHPGTQFKGYPYFTWSCLDNAHEVIHRIHLVVREWNTEEEFNKFVESNGSRGDPDVGGEEGTDCEYYSLPDHISSTGELSDKDQFFVFHECDDAVDLDDWEKSTPSTVSHPHVIYR